MPISDIERLEKLCHIRSCLFMAREHLVGKAIFPTESVIDSLNDGMAEVTLLILEVKKNGIT